MSEIPHDRIFLEINPEITAKIDVLIEEGLYPSRVAFIEQAISSQLKHHQPTFDKYEKQKSFVIGFVKYSAKNLEKVIAKNKRLEIKVIGILNFGDDITPELFDRAVVKINLAGHLKAPSNLFPLINERRYNLLGKQYKKFRELTLGEKPDKLQE